MHALKMVKVVKVQQKTDKGNDIFAMQFLDDNGEKFYTTFECKPNHSEGVIKTMRRIVPIDSFKDTRPASGIIVRSKND